MSASALKNRIIEKVSSITDETILEEIERFVNHESDTEEKYKFTPLERQAINKGLEDIKMGEVYTSEEAAQMMKEWLKK
ncbi:hypothetical protein [Anditalea andensis]|uniref:Uncharacterized protein n=1 Tax=Anditalea andensis TaxID=1048983 RepID=A0A074KY97_9BACT|nr:hypothetical protein [Anditalea andensis]KEO74961.1 hypothetical protein EL17_04600 [Anditalea andensis]